MFRFVKNASAALALTGLVLSQQAMAVRSSGSLEAAGAPASRAGTPVGASEDISGIPTFGWLIALAIVIGAVVIIADDNNEPVSP